MKIVNTLRICHSERSKESLFHNQASQRREPSLRFSRLAAASIKLQPPRLLIQFGQCLFGSFIHVLQSPLFSHKRVATKKLIHVIQCDGRSIHEFEIMAIIDGIVRIVRNKG